MGVLYVTEQGARVRREHGRLLIQVGGVTRTEVRLLTLEQVVLFGAVQLSSGAVDALLAQGVDVAFLTRGGRLKGRLVSAESKNLPLRQAQYAAQGDRTRALAIGRGLVDAKLRSARRLLSRYGAEHPEVDLAEAVAGLGRAAAGAEAAADMDALRGWEGRGAAVYFGAFKRLLRGDLTFDRRRRRPPPDPVNALLSLGYSLVGTELAGTLSAAGFDPYLGFLHAPRYGRLSLALDLLEVFRVAAVDRLVLSLANKRRLDPADFEVDEVDGVRLTTPALRLFLTAYEEHLTRPFQHAGRRLALRPLFVQETRALARTVRDGDPLRPYVLR